jgi:hypothetical protein
MTIKQQTDSIVDKFKPHVNPYIGSGMLSNTHDDGAIAWQATHCAIIHVEGILEELETLNYPNQIWGQAVSRILELKDILTELKSRI